MTLNLDSRLADGDATHTDVVEHLVAHYYTGVHHLALSLLGDTAEADDVAQQTMIQAANKINQYEPHTNMKAWVYQFGVNNARALLRKRIARERMHQLLHRNIPKTSCTNMPEEAAEMSEQKRWLWSAVQTLPPKHRFPIVLRYLFDFSTAEIAQILDVPGGTVRSRLHYAEKKLHGLLVATEVTR